MGVRRAAVLFGTALALAMCSRASAQETRVTGHVEADNIGYFEPTDTARRAGRHEMLAKADGSVAFGRPFRLFASAELRADFADRQRDRLYVRELYADVVYKAFDLRVGRQIIAWGK